MRTLLALCLLLISGPNRAAATGNSTVDGGADGRRRNQTGYISIGDGSAQEFEFPENAEGVIVSSSRYRGSGWTETVEVRSSDPEVLSISNVTDGGRAGPTGGGRFIVRIRSGFPGRAPSRIRSSDRDQGSVPVSIEERTDYSIRVEPSEPPSRPGGSSHFTEHPVSFASSPLIFVNKCAFGCKVEVEVSRRSSRSPWASSSGVSAQFSVMPLYAYCASRSSASPTPLALGSVITCSAPGGGGGYSYSSSSGGDVTSAISMTSVSTVVATAAMPSSSASYGRSSGVHAALHVPFVKISGTLLFIAIPISSGMSVKLRSPALTRVSSSLIRPLSSVSMIGGVFMAYQMGASISADVQPRIVAVGVTVPSSGSSVGAASAWAAGSAAAQRRTVSIEVGVQNSSSASAVMQSSFRRQEADFASQAPFIVASSSTSEMLLIVSAHFVQQRFCRSDS